MTESGHASPMTEVRALLAGATQRLLGDTIALSDDDWTGPSLLPDWTRGHVGAHLARNADAITRLAEGVVSGVPGIMYPDDREAEIERDAPRGGMEQQVDLDSSAQQLGAAFDAIERAEAWTVKVEMRHGLERPASYLPLARLAEVVLHHIDLDCGYHAADMGHDTAAWLLQLCAYRLNGRDDVAPLTVRPDGDDPIDIGTAPGERAIVSGPAGPLVGWLCGRNDATGLQGAEGLTAPGFG